jgi:hypothetical protein
MRKIVLEFFPLSTLLLLAVSCSLTKQKLGMAPKEDVHGGKEYADAFVSQIKPRWFKTADRFQLLDDKKDIVPHRFFDVAPNLDLNKKTANVVITAPEGIEFGFDLDILSGQYFVSRKFCEQRDQWNKYSSTVERPPFSIGILPRVLDQLNLPQKVIVFGGKDYFQKYFQTHLFDVRIVGAFIEQICPVGACLDNAQWNSRLVLVAVHPGEPKYKEVQDLNDLKKLTDWEYVRAFEENGMGSNKVSTKYFPGYRMGAEVTAGQALSFMEKNSTIFTIDRLGKMRLSCYKLYDFLWKDLSYISADEIVAKNKREIREKAIKLNQSLGKTTEVVKPFYARFVKDFKRYHEQYKTCTKYIYPASMNDSPERQWFFAYYSAFHNLHELGYVYNCNGNKWEYNPYVGDNTRAIPMEDQLVNCSARDIDVAMEYAVETLESLRAKEKKSYRYIDYDRGAYGTHVKMYSWVPTSTKSYACNNEEDKNFILSRQSFPRDIRWQKRGKEGKTKTELGDIIY